jgi:ketosteroid isomerase-like protein
MGYVGGPVPDPEEGLWTRSGSRVLPNLAGTFDDWSFEAEEIIDAGSSVFVCFHQSGRGKGSGIPVENRFYTVWTFERDKVIRYRAFMGRTEALEAAGLRE